MEWASDICSALASAHGEGIIHRDIKPQNLLLTRKGNGTEDIKLIDFGIAKARPEAGLGFTGVMKTKTGMVACSPYYASPEQAMGAVLDHRTDLYSFGIVLYEMLTGQLPFTGDEVEMFRQRSLVDPRPIHHVRSDLGSEISVLVMKALARDRDARYATATEMKQACDEARANYVATRQIAHDQQAARRDCLAFFPDGKWLLTGGENEARIWDLSTGGEVARLDHSQRVEKVAVSADGSFVVTGSQSSIFRWEPSTGHKVGEGALRYLTNWLLAPNGQYLAVEEWLKVYSRVRIIKSIDLIHAFEVDKIDGLGYGKLLSLSPNSRILAWGPNDEGCVALIDLKARTLVAELRHHGTVGGIAFSTDSKLIASTCGDDGALHVWDVVTGTELATDNQGPGLFDVEFSPDERWIATGACNAAYLWDVRRESRVATLPHLDDVLQVVFSADSRWLFTVTRGGSDVQIWDTQTWCLANRLLPQDPSVSHISLSPDGSRLAVVSNAGAITIWRAGQTRNGAVWTGD